MIFKIGESLPYKIVALLHCLICKIGESLPYLLPLCQAAAAAFLKPGKQKKPKKNSGGKKVKTKAKK